MGRTLGILAAKAAVCLCCIAPAFAGTTVPGMGTNYFAYDLGSYDPERPGGPGNNVYSPGENFKTPIGLYQLMPTEVDTQIADMRASGMDYIVLQINMADLAPCKQEGTCSDGAPQDWLWGYLLDDSDSRLRPTQQDNLVSLLQDIRRNGFRRVVIRFADADVAKWTSWNEVQYQMAWRLMESVHDLVGQQLAGSATTPIYDLGMEAIGATRPETEDYVRRLWTDYTNEFGTSDTVGFSTIGDAEHLRALNWYGAKRPGMYAFDIYRNIGTGLARVWNALGDERTKPIIIMETYPNDPLVAEQIRDVLAAFPDMDVVAVVSWPSGRNVPACSGCNPNISTAAVRALDTTTQLSNLEDLASKVVIDNSAGNLLAITDVDCGSTSAPTCSVKVDEGSPPSGGQEEYQVYMTSAQLGGGSSLVSCGPNGPGPDPSEVERIQRDVTYEFQSYRVGSCRDSIAGKSPSATSIVSVR